MKPKKTARPHGQIRQSQIVATFGPGAIIDLPNHSVLMGGLEFWNGANREIHEPRLAGKAEDLTGIRNLTLREPPPEETNPSKPQTGIAVFQFPEWFITQDVSASEPGRPTRSRFLIHRLRLTKSKFIDADGRKRPVVPVRFVRACRRGHIGDIDWYSFVHRGETDCRRQLYIDERGTSGDLSEVWVRCACGKDRPMSDAATSEFKALGPCDGARPWLGPRTREACDETSRLLVRTASNAYFPQILSVISLPEEDDGLRRAIDSIWEHYLQYVDSVEDLLRERKKKPPVASALEPFGDDEVMQAILRKRSALSAGARGPSVKQAEIEILSIDRKEIGSDRPDGQFFATALPRDRWEKPCTWPIERVVLVHRLREVRALIGFSRFEPMSPDIEGELDIGVRRAFLSRETSWLPAVENRGEGLFVQVSPEAIENWLGRAAVKARGLQLSAGFEEWKAEHKGTKRAFPGAPYVMLHTLSHLLLNAIALECGYPASSIRERVYAGPSGYGILLYTGSSDAEGTLGGLVDAGSRIHTHIATAMEMGRLCSNDPICACHNPSDRLERRFLVGAACHACLLIAETSCEAHNDLLDRALVVPTLENLGAEFLPEE